MKAAGIQRILRGFASLRRVPTDAVADRGGPAPTVRIDAFGPLAATVEGRAVELGPHKRRLLLAVLLCHPGSEVPSGELVQALWGDHPPVSAANNLRSYIFGLRRTLGAATISGNGRPGYRLHTESLTTDINRFRELCAEADRAADRGDARAARAALASALALRRDRAFADVADAPAVVDEAGRLEERWLFAAEQRVEIDLRLGRAAEVVGELTALTARQPYRENLARLLMLALHRSGRRPEAIAVYRRAAAALREDLDIEPGTALTELHRTLLHAVPERPQPGHPVPAELPARTAPFTGRTPETRQLAEIVREGRRGRVLPVVHVGGPAGVGKTALVVHWGHRAAELFSDGQIFVDMRGTTPQAALHRMLRSLGVTGGELPEDVPEAAALYRSLLAERRTLVVLDDVASGQRIDELLPGGSGNAVLVTGRGPLPGLGGARRMVLAPLPADEAYELLGGLIGRSRAAAGPEAVRELARRCGHRPAELCAAATELAAQPGTTVSAYLADRRTGTEKEPGGIVWSAFDLSLRTLTGGQQELLALLGLVPGRDLALPAAAALTGRSPDEVEPDLLVLADAGLLRPGRDRFGFPEGFHSYVRERLPAPPAAARAAAIERLYTWYRDTADAADRVLHPGALRLPMTVTGPEPAKLDEQAAREWFAAESANLVAACLRDGPFPLLVRIADALGGYLWTSRELDTWSILARETLRAARSAGDLPAQTAAQVALAKIAECRCDYPQAVSRLADAVRLSREAGWRAAEAVALGSLAALQSELGDTRRAARQFGAVLAISRETGSRLQEGRTLVHLGILHREQGRLQPAYDSFQQALPLIEAESSLVGRAIIENNLAETCVLRGDFDEAHERATEALRICRDVGHVSSTTSAYVMLSAAGRGRGDARTAAHHAALALAVAARLDDAYLLGVAAHEAGAVHDALGEPGRALEHHRTAYRMTARIRSRFLEVRHAIALAIAEHRLAVATGLPPDRPGGPDLRQALGQARNGGYRGLEKAALAGLAEQRRPVSPPAS